MKKEFSMSNDKVMINFTTKYCNNIDSVLESEGFRRVLTSYLEKSKRKNTLTYRFLTDSLESNDTSKICKTLIKAIKFLTIMSVEEIIELSPGFEALLSNKDSFIRFIEEFYSYWRRLERYTIIHRYKLRKGLAAMSFTEANAEFSVIILKLYRKVEKMY